MAPEAPAFVAGALGLWCAAEIGAIAVERLRGAAPAGAEWLGQALGAFAGIAREGRDPGWRDRRRLLITGGAAALIVGVVVIGPVGGLLGAVGGTLGMARLMAARRARYRAAVAGGASAMATGLADAVSGGHSVRGAVAIAAEGLNGPPAAELARVAAEIELGQPTAEALEAMRSRAGSPEIDAIVAATSLQARAGGDLARLLRDLARAFEDQVRVEGEVKAATAQARFTGVVVILLPVGGALLGELAAPGFLAGLLGDPLSAWLLLVAVVLQVVAAVAIRRLGRVSV